MTVGELRRMLDRYDDADWVEFEDKTFGRICPANSTYVTKSSTGHRIIRICNTLGEKRA